MEINEDRQNKMQVRPNMTPKLKTRHGRILKHVHKEIYKQMYIKKSTNKKKKILKLKTKMSNKNHPKILLYRLKFCMDESYMITIERYGESVPN